ncbi:hypothetical protein P154DRAFT_525359 [Amniculicola lignicola CBS 123094]|uniref:tRNA/rRNA methyltransferase SpoU type domain-containing protein n=1 Tax=Amniculicola lignicola CBS 123094 TaxID=1392246 RepID=A0A6A5W637_9PLEO|nr:hypothetical protein P154DRAFT_525359 [Amniculicola lignicola CBS 123094]
MDDDILGELLTGGLQLSTTGAGRESLYEHFFAKLRHRKERQGILDLGLLRVCLRVLSESTQNAELCLLVLDEITLGSGDADGLCTLAKLCLGNVNFGKQLFHDVQLRLIKTHQLLIGRKKELDEGEQFVVDAEKATARRLLDFLKCSYWLPAETAHFISEDLFQTIVDFVALHNLAHTDFEELEHAAYDTISALLTLLEKPVMVLMSSESIPHLSSDVTNVGRILNYISAQLWTRLRTLDIHAFASKAGLLFRTWFQWISFAAANDIKLPALNNPQYWEILRLGLVDGFAEQRKYCLGILHQSLLLAREDIDTPCMKLAVNKRSDYQKQYEKYAILFEMIVLDRYANQVEACLPDLTNLLRPGSLISSGWVTALLSAALNSKIQEGSRKIVGRWYMEFVIEEKGPFIDHIDFLIEGFLPWATTGYLFTATLSSTPSCTVCSHGEALANVLTRFLTSTLEVSERRQLFNKIFKFIIDRRGKLFQYSTAYMLQGVVEASKSGPLLLSTEIDLILQVSRLTGLPEIASDLCTTYCNELCERSFSHLPEPRNLPGYEMLALKYQSLNADATGRSQDWLKRHMSVGTSNQSPLQVFLAALGASHHRLIRDNELMPACHEVVRILDAGSESVDSTELFTALEAIWEEADRQEFRRVVAFKLLPLFFHSVCLRLCMEETGESPLTSLLTRVMMQFQHLLEGRTYLLSLFVGSLRIACFGSPRIMSILPFEDFLVQFIERPPSPRKEFLFEAAAAESLQQYLPRCTYFSYYGKREWYGYACLIDILVRFPRDQIDVAERVLRRLLEPWTSQKPPIPIISKWKHAFQLQAMLLLSESCISDTNAVWFLEAFLTALKVEQWPRYRFLLEWIISRIYYKFPRLSSRILTDLSSADEALPALVSSYMKLAVLAVPHLNSEEFAVQLLVQLVTFGTSSKVHVRHEAQWSFPIVWAHAEVKNWTVILNDPAFQGLNAYIRGLKKFTEPIYSIRTISLDVVADFTLVNIFQGEYLQFDNPEKELVAYEDFQDLYDSSALGNAGSSNIPLGSPKNTSSRAPVFDTSSTGTPTSSEPTPLQTKSGFTASSLLPAFGPPSTQNQRPTTLILVASLIDNPTNLGGLSRIAESFGLEALYINDMRHVAVKDFKATSVTSHLHFPIKELRVGDVPAWLGSIKGEGYTVVGVEQTDRSGVLGEEKIEGDDAGSGGREGGLVKNVGGSSEGDGTLPRKCVLVLGSEKGGISAEVLRVVDRCVEIRTVGVTRSLNVQTAGGIAVYEWWREWGGR